MQSIYTILLTIILFLTSINLSVSADNSSQTESKSAVSSIFLLLLSKSPAERAHLTIKEWRGTSTCLACHQTEGEQIFNSVHYQWLGVTPYMTDGPPIQGKLDGGDYSGVNSYCINITGNWSGCGTCHVGLGLRPEAVVSDKQLENIDCLICHQDVYKRKRDGDYFVPDSVNMKINMVKAAQTVHLPTRVGCLQCHAKGGGGDNYKRGDMALAHGTTFDRNFDVHMARSGANLSCQTCHITQNHRMAGRGSDLRTTDLDIKMECSRCHRKDNSEWRHGDRKLDKHLARVACQTCHIPLYGRNASDTAAHEKTETHRDWRVSHATPSGAIHPTPVMEGNLVPKYDWWNGYNSSYLLFDDAVVDPGTGRIPTSRPEGSVNGTGSKLFPFKYKTATQPLALTSNKLIALDTSVYFSTGDDDAAILAGLANMGLSGEPYSWIETDTMQLITHEVAPEEMALKCSECHNTIARMDLQADLGFELKGQKSVVCTQCHGVKDDEDEPAYLWIHAEHVEEEEYDCSWCHPFSRPERGLIMP